MVQFDGFGAETNEPNTKFKCVGAPRGRGGGIYTDPLVYEMGTTDTPMDPFFS